MANDRMYLINPHLPPDHEDFAALIAKSPDGETFHPVPDLLQRLEALMVCAPYGTHKDFRVAFETDDYSLELAEEDVTTAKLKRSIIECRDLHNQMRDKGDHYTADKIARLCRSASSSTGTNRMLARDLRQAVARIKELEEQLGSKGD